MCTAASMQPDSESTSCNQKARGMGLLLKSLPKESQCPESPSRRRLGLCMPRAKNTSWVALSCNIAWLMYVRSKEYKVALRWLSWLLTERRGDPGLWSIVGYVQLMLGDISVADRTLHKAAELLSAAQTPQQKQANQAIVRQHQGLLLFARNDFAGPSDCLLHLALKWSVVTNACPARTGVLLCPCMKPYIQFAKHHVLLSFTSFMSCGCCCV